MTIRRSTIAIPLVAGAFVLALPSVASASNASTSWILDPNQTNVKVTHTYTDSTNTITVSRGSNFGSVRTYIKPRAGVSGGSATVTLSDGSTGTRSSKLTGLPEDKAYTLYGQVYSGGKWVTKKTVNFYT